jgi:hypothetical protein
MPTFQTFAVDAALAGMNVSSAQKAVGANLQTTVVLQDMNGPKPTLVCHAAKVRFEPCFASQDLH